MKHNKMPNAVQEAIANVDSELKKVSTRLLRVKAYLPVVERGLNSKGLTIKRCYLPDEHGVTSLEVLPLKGGKFHYVAKPDEVNVSRASRHYRDQLKWHQEDLERLGYEIEVAIVNCAPGLEMVEVNEYSLAVPRGMKKSYQPNILLTIEF